MAAEHAIAATADETDWSRIVARYDELLGLVDSPSSGSTAPSRSARPTVRWPGWPRLAGLTEEELPGHRLPAARAELLARAGRTDEALVAYDAAIERCANEAERAHLEERRAALPRG